MYGENLYEFEDPDEVARYSFLVHKSVTYLDLNTREFAYRVKTTNTREGFQKMVAENRKILYVYHLDISKLLEKSLKKLRTRYTTDIYKGFLVNKITYYGGFMDDIETFIANSSDKLSELRRFLRPIKMMRGCPEDFHSNQYSFFMHILLEECSDSQLVMDFVEACGQSFRYWLVNINDEIPIVDYVLYHAQKMNIEIFPQCELFCPTNRSLFWGRIRCVIPLVKYGIIKKPTKFEVRIDIDIFCCNYSLIYNPNDMFATHFRPVRKWRLIQLAHVFLGQTTLPKKSEFAIQALSLIWKSIPDPYLSRSEIGAVFKESSVHHPVCQEIFGFYRDVVLGGVDRCEVRQPRSLSHLARCAIRSRLSANFAVPGGIEHIGLPIMLQSFLKLDY